MTLFETPARSVQKIPHPDFVRRLEQACDHNNDVPRHNYGRLNWFVERLETHGVAASPEAVRKWFAGETRPRAKPMAALAQILKIDEGWLSSGRSPEFSEAQRKRQNVVVDGAVNLVAGLIQMDGGHPAFPSDDDTKAVTSKVNLYAIIKGAQYNFHVTAAIGEGNETHFLIPFEAETAIVLGVVRTGGFSFEVYELEWEVVVDTGTRKTTGYDVPLADRPWKKITTFSERI